MYIENKDYMEINFVVKELYPFALHSYLLLEFDTNGFCKETLISLGLKSDACDRKLEVVSTNSVT